MTPQPQRVPIYNGRDWAAEAAPAKGDSLKAEIMKYVIAMVVAGLTAYYAAIYGIREEIAVLKVRLEYMKEKVDSQTNAIDSLTRSINAHTLAHEEANRRRGARP
jgi:hypothetical protein